MCRSPRPWKYNIAARLEALASPDAVVISSVTARLVSGTFALEDLGTHTLRGVAEPMAISRVLGPLATPGPDEDVVTATVPTLVGREEEGGLLLRRWNESKAGLGQVVFVSGEAGIGKSALVGALRAHVRAEGSPRVAFRCSPYHTASALYPVITHLERVWQLAADDAPATRLNKLEARLRPSDLPLAEAVPLIAGLLAVPLPADRYAPLTGTRVRRGGPGAGAALHPRIRRCRRRAIYPRGGPVAISAMLGRIRRCSSS
jgi:hypothetical protein